MIDRRTFMVIHVINLQYVTSKATRYCQYTNNPLNADIKIQALPRALEILESLYIWEKQAETLEWR